MEDEDFTRIEQLLAQSQRDLAAAQTRLDRVLELFRPMRASRFAVCETDPSSKATQESLAKEEKPTLFGESENLLVAPANGAGEGKRIMPADRVWAHYVAVMRPRGSKLTPDVRRLILDALKVASEDELLRAVDGCKASPFHMGHNDRHQKYDRPSHIFKGKQRIRTTREQIDLFIDIAEKTQPPDPSGTPARVQRALSLILAAKNDPAADQELAAEARAHLEREGIDVDSLIS